ELHGHIWEAFGPDVAPKNSGTGIGGRATPTERPMGKLSAMVQLDLLAENVIEEGESLRALDKLLTSARQALPALPSGCGGRGARLSLSAKTGRSSGPHLHYEVMVRGQAVNPRAYLWD